MIVIAHEVLLCLVFFFNDTATTEIYTLSLHDALPISPFSWVSPSDISIENSLPSFRSPTSSVVPPTTRTSPVRSEEHTSELQSRQYLVCRLLLEKKKNSSCLLSIYRISYPIRA